MIRMRDVSNSDLCVESSTSGSRRGGQPGGAAALATVLIVDDQRVILRVFAQALEEVGYGVRTADSAEAALDIVRTDSPDAILADLTMPFVNGLGFLYRLREIAPTIPVAMITGNALTSETRDELQSLDAAVHFKPLTAAQIQAVAATLVRHADPS